MSRVALPIQGWATRKATGILAVSKCVGRALGREAGCRIESVFTERDEVRIWVI